LRSSIPEKVRLVDELLKQGKGVREACRIVGLSKGTYYYWRDKLRNGGEVVEQEDPPQDEEESREDVEKGVEGSEESSIDEVSGIMRRLTSTPTLDENLKYIESERPAHPLEQKAKELLDEIRRTTTAMSRIQMMLSTFAPSYTPNMQPQPTNKQVSERGVPEQAVTMPEVPLSPEEVIEKLSDEVRRLEERRRKLKEALEKLGFKVEDRLLTKDEVERILEEEKRRWEEEQLDDARIKAVVEIVKTGIDRIVGMFQPLVQAWFDFELRRRMGMEVGTTVGLQSTATNPSMPTGHAVPTGPPPDVGSIRVPVRGSEEVKVEGGGDKKDREGVSSSGEGGD